MCVYIYIVVEDIINRISGLRYINNIRIKRRMAELTLVSEEGTQVKVPQDIMKHSKLIETVLQDGSAEDPIPLPKVKKATLDKVIEFCEHYKDIDMPAPERPIKATYIDDWLDDWLRKYLEINQNDLFALIEAANYLDIKGLFDLACSSCAFKIKGKKAEEIREQFGIDKDLNPEEEKEINEFFQWAEDLWG